MALTTAKHICRMPCCVLLLLYCTMEPKSTWNFVWILQNLLLPCGFLQKPLGPKPQIKQTNTQPTLYWNFWIFHYFHYLDGKYRKYLMKHQNLITTSKRTLAPMCDVLLLRQQAFSLFSLSLSLPTTTYIHTYVHRFM